MSTKPTCADTHPSNLWNRRALLTRGALLAAAGTTMASPVRAEILGKGFEGLSGKPAAMALDLLSQSRQASFGAGKDVWIWISSLCPYCQKYFREFPDLTVKGFRVHYIPFILGDRESGAVLKVVENPTQANFLKFMRRELLDEKPVAYNPLYTGSLDYSGPPSVLLARHYARLRMTQTVFDGDAGYPTQTGLNRTLSTPRTFFQTQKGALLMWGGGFGAEQYKLLRDL